MSSIVIFLAVIASISGWWLSRQRLTAKPWLEEGDTSAFPGTDALALSPTTVGLGVFLAVVGSLFALLISAYSIRMGMEDWRALPLPRLLWFNTGALVLGSCALLWAQVSVRRQEMDGVKVSLLAGGFFTVIFLIGQIAAWRQLVVGGYFLSTNPANTFFYLITGLHGLHVLGGLAALGRTADKVWRGTDIRRIRLSVELCAVYWHFLLFIWLILLSLLTGWAGDFIAVCRGFLS
ncbi:cytochrome c oxidase subunit 3 [Microvirga sp. 2TAF3]|uniref:cytochrome c oxidase subunit 3 n=1 Tax=Microvirga sp. 2TAF3 TaxID=3233014 RepID=UPI003F951A8D